MVKSEVVGSQTMRSNDWMEPTANEELLKRLKIHRCPDPKVRE